MSTDLAALIGLPTAPGPPQRFEQVLPETVLNALEIGPYSQMRCAPAPSPGRFTWCQLTTLPGNDDRLTPPVELLLISLHGTHARLWLRVLHHGEGLAMFLGSDDPAVVALARRLLSPGVSTWPMSKAAPAVPGRTVQSGLVLRPQVEAADAGHVCGYRGVSALDRLAAVEGTWSVDFLLDATFAPEVRLARALAQDLADRAAQSLRTTQQVTAQMSATTESPTWQRVLDWVVMTHELLTEAGAQGGWRVSTWLTATSDEVLTRLRSVMHSAFFSGPGPRLIAYDLAPAVGAPPPTSVLTSQRFAAVLAPPKRSLPGIVVRKVPPAHIRPRTTAEPLVLGTYPGPETRTVLGLDDLEGHAFITGTTGSGKTTTVHRLLSECWNRHEVPFLIIDPAKDDYKPLAECLNGGLQVVRGADLRTDLMQAWDGEDPIVHVSRIAQAFKGSFTMPSPTPYVVTQLFDAVAVQPGGPAGVTLHDVAAMLDPIVDGLGYAAEARMNIRAALRTRFGTLLSPLCAHRFAWRDSAQIDRLLSTPSAVTLTDLADEEERSFVVLTLCLAVWARARSRRGARSVAHLLVLEEAHQVIPEVSQETDPESGSAQRSSARLLSEMLAEVREYGEQVVVVDQSPGQVATNVLRNTNLKVAHRIVHPDDQAAVAGAIGMELDDADLLGTVERGYAVISTRNEPQPQYVAVSPARRRGGKTMTSPAESSERWQCQCPDLPSHYRAMLLGDEAAEPMGWLYAALVSRGAIGPARLAAQEGMTRVSSYEGVPADCLAWAGLSRVTGRLQAHGALPAGLSRAETLDLAFQPPWWPRSSEECCRTPDACPTGASPGA